MTEAELQLKVQELCDELGLLWHHCKDSRKCDGRKGVPDLVIAGPGGIILPELKSEDGETDGPQDLWGWTLSQAWKAMGANSHPYAGWFIWRPHHLADGTIRRFLEGIAA